MVEGTEKVEEAGVGVDESESASSSSSPGHRASLGGESGFLLLFRSVRAVPAARVVAAAGAACEMVEESGRCEAARRSDLSSLSPRRRPDMGFDMAVRSVLASTPMVSGVLGSARVPALHCCAAVQLCRCMRNIGGLGRCVLLSAMQLQAKDGCIDNAQPRGGDVSESADGGGTGQADMQGGKDEMVK